MTTSGTTSWNPGISEIIEEAYERCGLEIRSGYEFRTAVRSLNFLCAEWANKGLNLWTIDQQMVTLIPGQISYTLPADTIDTIEHEIRLIGQTPQTDLFVEKVSVSTYAQIPNKTSPGRPVQVYVQRLETAPIINLWPAPDQAYTFVYWRLRRMQDAGTAINTMDLPFRFIPALVAGLAYYVAMKKPQAQDRVIPLKQAYDEAFQLAADEDRDRSSVFFYPDNPLW